MNALKKNYLFLFLLLSFINPIFAASEEEVEENTEVEEEKEYIADVIEGFNKYEGFFETYQDPESSDLYLVINESQLNEEFIYFAHVVDGVVAARRNRGSYLDNGVFKIEKHFETLRLSRINTSYILNKKTALSKSEGANVSDSVLSSLSIKAKNKEENRFLINVTGLFLSEELTPIKPIPSPFENEKSFRWGQVSS